MSEAATLDRERLQHIHQLQTGQNAAVGERLDIEVKLFKGDGCNMDRLRGEAMRAINAINDRLGELGQNVRIAVRFIEYDYPCFESFGANTAARVAELSRRMETLMKPGSVALVTSYGLSESNPSGSMDHAKVILLDFLRAMGPFCVRPIRVADEAKSHPEANTVQRDFQTFTLDSQDSDQSIVREYPGYPGDEVGPDETITAVETSSKEAIEATVRQAFAYADEHQLSIVLLHKANVMKPSHAVWVEAFKACLAQFPAVAARLGVDEKAQLKAGLQLIDSGLELLVRSPDKLAPVVIAPPTEMALIKPTLDRFADPDRNGRPEIPAGTYDVLRFQAEGAYIMEGRVDGDEVTQKAVHTRSKVKQFVESAFRLALQKDGKVTLVTMSERFPQAYHVWRRVAKEVQQQAEFSGCTVEFVEASEMLQQIIWDSASLGKTIVCDNYLGDLISDAIAGFVALGLVPSSSVNPWDGSEIAYAEPAGGTAPTVAPDKINPVGMLKALAMMLRHIGLTPFATVIDDALNCALQAQVATPDVLPDSTYTTADVTKWVLQRVGRLELSPAA